MLLLFWFCFHTLEPHKFGNLNSNHNNISGSTPSRMKTTNLKGLKSGFSNIGRSIAKLFKPKELRNDIINSTTTISSQKQLHFAIIHTTHISTKEINSKRMVIKNLRNRPITNVQSVSVCGNPAESESEQLESTTEPSKAAPTSNSKISQSESSWNSNEVTDMQLFCSVTPSPIPKFRWFNSSLCLDVPTTAQSKSINESSVPFCYSNYQEPTKRSSQIPEVLIESIPKVDPSILFIEDGETRETTLAELIKRKEISPEDLDLLNYLQKDDSIFSSNDHRISDFSPNTLRICEAPCKKKNIFIKTGQTITFDSGKAGLCLVTPYVDKFDSSANGASFVYVGDAPNYESDSASFSSVSSSGGFSDVIDAYLDESMNGETNEVKGDNKLKYLNVGSLKRNSKDTNESANFEIKVDLCN